MTRVLNRIWKAVSWRLHRLLGDRIVYGALLSTARTIRKLLRKPVYIGITGSVGKTTSKELLLGILSTKGSGAGNYDSFNNIEEVAKGMLRLRPMHKFFVTELSGHSRKHLNETLELVRPEIGIVTIIGDDHSSKNYSRDDIAAVKGGLVESLPDTGTAVLNADDERVLAMAKRCKCKVITYGKSPSAKLRASKVRSNWPERLHFTASYGNQEAKVQTRLCGEQLLPSALGAIGGGLAMGLSLEQCVNGLGSIEPYDGRMQPVFTPRGITFIRDDFKAPLWTVESSLAFMRNAKAARKIVVIGTLSDGTSAGKSKDIFRVAVKAQKIADHVVFIGPWAYGALKAPPIDGKPAIRAFSHVKDAAAYLNTLLQSGDLVLLKGTNLQDHLVRIIFSSESSVACWQDNCKRMIFCSECELLNVPPGTSYTDPVVDNSVVSLESLTNSYGDVSPDEQIIIGLGNPEGQYAETPHNIGYAVVDSLAEDLNFDWVETPAAFTARGLWRNRSVCLVKVKLHINLTGGGLHRLATAMRFNSEQCILVFDDLSLPLGKVRAKLRGGAGGHRGVASILEAFQTDNFRRVKVGVNHPNSPLDNTDYVLSKFDASASEAVDRTIPLAKTRCMEMVNKALKSI